MPTAAIADPKLLRRPGPSRRRVAHFHLIAAALTPHLKPDVGHAADSTAGRMSAGVTGRMRGIVLAAGESTRMGAPKALLPDHQGRAFIARVLHVFQAAGLSDVTIVTGVLHARIVGAVARDAPRAMTVRFARNSDPSRGQLSSLQIGLDTAAAPDVDAVLVTLVDVPFVAAQTVRAVAEGYRRARAPIVRPARGNRHGHPVLFARRLFAALHQADPALGAKAVLRAYADEILNVEVDDEGAFVDLDTREDYERALDS
jgi:molybdenum cofactor cytidylyltransferase